MNVTVITEPRLARTYTAPARGLLYFVPDVGGHELLAPAGLDDRFDAPPYIFACAVGPGGRAGTAFSAVKTPPPWDAVRWTPDPTEPGIEPPFWVGVHPSTRPTPADLERRDATLAGISVPLADGNGWLVPIVDGADSRPPSLRTGLPTIPAECDGATTHIIAPRFAELAHRCTTIPELLRGWPARADEAFELCVELLSVAYRVSAAEVLALELLDADFEASVLAASIDWVARIRGVAEFLAGKPQQGSASGEGADGASNPPAAVGAQPGNPE